MDEALQAKNSPWHEGELALQRSVGAVDMMASVGQRQLAVSYTHLTLPTICSV